MTSQRTLDLPLTAAVLLLIVFGLPSVAAAWGPSVHLWIGDMILQGLAASLPAVAVLLRRYARSYLYGNIAPDFYVGKGSTGHDEHCHNWSQGKKLLKTAATEEQRAFALGYLSHLAADIIGHNHYVPNWLYRSRGLKKLGHAYWELHADNLVEGRYSALAETLTQTPEPANDALLDRVMRNGIVPFRAKKRLFSGWLSFSNRERYQRLLGRLRPYSHLLLRNDAIRDQMEISLALAVEMLRDPEVPLLGRYDPVGAANIKTAKKLRRQSRRARTFSRNDLPFPIPAELIALRSNLDHFQALVSGARREAEAYLAIAAARSAGGS